MSIAAEKPSGAATEMLRAYVPSDLAEEIRVEAARRRTSISRIVSERVAHSRLVHPEPLSPETGRYAVNKS